MAVAPLVTDTCPGTGSPDCCSLSRKVDEVMELTSIGSSNTATTGVWTDTFVAEAAGVVDTTVGGTKS